MKCCMCENTKHLKPCMFCADKTKVYCRVCIRKHYRKIHKDDNKQRGISMGDVLMKQKQLKYRCEGCKKYSKNGGSCPECGKQLRRMK